MKFLTIRFDNGIVYSGFAQSLQCWGDGGFTVHLLDGHFNLARYRTTVDIEWSAAPKFI